VRTLERPRLRLEHAKSHRARVAELWNGFIDGDEPYEVIVHVDDDGQGAIEVYPDREAMPMDAISLEFGELLYQLRAGLDSLVYELAIIDSGQDPPPDAEKLEFPIRPTPAAFARAASKIGPLSQRHRHMIEGLQTFPTPGQSEAMKLMADSLRLLHDWARKDRHRGLHVVASWGANRDPLVNPPMGCTVDSLVTAADGPLEQESRVATFHVSGWHRGMHIEANPNLTIDLAIDEPPPPADDEDTLTNRVKKMIVIVELVIEGFESTLGP